MGGSSEGAKTLLEFMGKGGAAVGDDLALLLAHLQHACKRIAAVVASPFGSEIGRRVGLEGVGSLSTAGRDAPKPLDIVSSIRRCCHRRNEVAAPLPTTVADAATAHTRKVAALLALPVLVYADASDISLVGAHSCCICMEELKNGEEIRVLAACHHGYHKACIDRWLLGFSDVCPICRASAFGSPPTSAVSSPEMEIVIQP